MIKKLQNKIDHNFMCFMGQLMTKMKSLLMRIFGNVCQFNLNYLDYYFSCREIGIHPVSNYSILKIEAIGVLKNYLRLHPHSSKREFLQSAIETIEHDNQGINQHSKDITDRFINVLKFLNTLRLVLIDNKKSKLLIEVTRVIDRALLIERSDDERTYAVQHHLLMKGHDLVEIEIKKLENKRAKKINLGMFSIKNTSGIKFSSPVNEYTLKRHYLRTS